jgi:hypothetical protein
MRRLQIIGALCLVVATTLIVAGSASAAPSDPFQFKYSFNGSGLPSGLSEPVALAVNNQTGDILVSDRAQGTIDQFDSEGNPVNFPATGSPQISLVAGGGGYIVVDNSGGPTQGNIYVFGNEYPGYLYTYYPDGSPIPGGSGGGLHVPSYEGIGSGFSCYGGGVGPDGELWFNSNTYSGGNPSAAAVELTPEGVPTGKEEQISVPEGVGFTNGCQMAFDGVGNAYVPRNSNSFVIPLTKIDAKNNFTSLGDIGLKGNFNGIGEIAVDPATNDLYVDEHTKVMRSAYSDPLVERPATEAIAGISESHGIAFDPTGQFLYVSEGNRIDVFHREPASAPYGLGQLGIDEIRSDGAKVHGEVTAGGAQTTYHFEYGTTAAYGSSSEDTQVPLSYFPVKTVLHVGDLQPGTTYHARMVATNSAGTTYGPDRVFKTYALPPGSDTCPNALARKQTLAQRLPDCRAYELASAGDTGGYDVESYLAPGQSPFGGFPLATDKLLYATHSGAVPGPWNATNKGPDPYLATRTASGWTTNYEGLPANLNPAAGSFSSVLGEADPSLSTLAFAGPNLCSPCFTGGGLETGIPVRLSNGNLVQGMSGSLSASVPTSAKPEGKLAKYFSADGKRLIFASKYAFEPGANTGGDLTVYERDLAAGTTEVVSTDPSGNALTGTISELGVSSDGSRVVTGKRVSVDSQGNEYVHPYLHISGRSDSVDLAPGTTTGVLFAGMSEDGSKVFFTTADKLLSGDTDSSADLYEAEVDGSGNLELSLVTNNNSDACNPVANTNGAHWNTTGSAADCGAVAIAGGGGVASASGAVYFLSPERFGGEGTLNQPNLYLAQPGGSPTFVATLEPSNPLVLDSVKANAARKTGDFQTTPSGNYTTFPSDLELSGVHTFGFLQVFRYDASDAQLACASCDITGTGDSSLAGDAELAPIGLSLLEDGRLFFTTRLALVLNDANARKDVYEWSEGGGQQLISGGFGPFDSGLLTASADGTDVFFFTHDTLASEEDRNGNLMKIYDAREGGGFFRLPQNVPCQASDECHGAGTPAPGPADIKSSGKTTQGNVLVCAKNRVKKRGQCVKQKHAKKKHAKKRKGAAKKRAAKANGKRGGRNA